MLLGGEVILTGRTSTLTTGLLLETNRSGIMVKLSQCLADLGCTASTFENCDNVDDELKVIRKIWTKLVLIQHPVSKLNLEWTIRSIFILK
jgi:hypothetical protein